LADPRGQEKNRIGDLAPPEALANAVGGTFRETGREFLRYFVEIGGLQPHHRVLDVGCGVGRMAVPLMEYLDANGRYEGFDVMPNLIRWCQEEITPRDSRFRFRHVDLHNPTYNPGGGTAAADHRFPYADASFDFVILTSVFTHMRPEGVRRYLAEIARVLAPAGRCFATFFLLNAESLALIRAGLSPYFRFAHLHDGFRANDRDLPENAVAYDEEQVRGWYGECGLAWVGSPAYGHWCTRLNGLSLQDIVVAGAVRDRADA
jgi:SAM-dependent methyltransferase